MVSQKYYPNGDSGKWWTRTLNLGTTSVRQIVVPLPDDNGHINIIENNSEGVHTNALGIVPVIRIGGLR